MGDLLAEWKQRFFPNSVVAQALTRLDQCDSIFGLELTWNDVKTAVRRALLSLSSKAKTSMQGEWDAANMILAVISR